MDDDWDDGPASVPAPPAPSYNSQNDFSSHNVGKGRGFSPINNEENNGWGSGNGFGSGNDFGGSGRSDSYDSGRGSRGGRGGRGRGGRGEGRGGGGRGGRFGDDDRGGRREGDWTCPDADCGNSNFGWRQQCQKCNTDKPAGSGNDRFSDDRGGGRGGRRGGRFEDNDGDRRGGRYNNNSDDESGGFSRGRGGSFGGGRGRGGSRGDGDNDGKKEGDWTCPDADCGNSNFGWRRNCQKCDTDRPEGLGNDKPKTELYIPPEPTDDDDILYGGGIASGLNFDKYDKIKVKVTGNNIPDHVNSFDSAGLRPFVLDNIRKSGYTKPTPVQKYAIPIIMSGRDLMACAQTGSGKTAAFLIPIINTLLEHPTDLQFEGETCEPQVVIVSPTRELTIQIFDEARKFSKGSILKVCISYGGTGTMHQAGKLMNGCHILVATPGRLNDFVGRGRVAFGSVRFFVLDEADRMLDMGFLDDMKKMLTHDSMVATGERQTLMFSATFPVEIQQLAGQFLNNYLFATFGIVGGACADVEQVFYQVARNEKRNKLKELLTVNEDKVLVFVETKRSADFIAVYLSEQHIPTTSIHGDRMQRERETALNDFKYNRMRVLVATAVAARGLDIKGVAHVVNYDLPKSIDEYVHRIGRTGRVGNRGKATSFFDSENDGPLATDLVKILQQAEQEVPGWLDQGSFGGSSGYSGGRGFGGTDYRKADSFNNGPQPQAMEEEEQW